MLWTVDELGHLVFENDSEIMIHPNGSGEILQLFENGNFFKNCLSE
jgi:hypothetical protein